MSSPVFVRLAPGPNPSKFAYASITGAVVTYRIAATTDDEALALAVASPTNKGLACETELADAARRKGLDVRALTGAELLAKATAAAPLLAEDAYGNCPEDEAITDLWEACRAFALALAKETRTHWYVAATATGTIEDTAIERDLLLFVQTGPLALRIFDHAVAGQLFAPASKEPEDLDHWFVELLAEPAELRAMLRGAIGLDAVPRVRAMSGHAGELVDDVTMELVAACTGAIARHVAANAAGIVYKPLLGGEVQIKLRTYVHA